jgi:hypothetical protein
MKSGDRVHLRRWGRAGVGDGVHAGYNVAAVLSGRGPDAAKLKGL